ncbi:TetR/AcrR family transcriptional regulator [Granulicella tundricola]|uniref:Regulatory protein TetR n=1 Tax=Granulicella tundricola (strain ATCC BAA-1859 / DSM 23138 / MP5ACTX9) TaxID=1198114 RepID=E8X3N0_GRATM|nr:TetR/AcrR family transcriptional regulator [Granulicella tundricola]ADW68221.1 regulatory protein TetR [Granulicella tundricola MP5ACTX9]
MGLREKKAQRSRDRIVAEAMTLFSRNGFEPTTMESIAEAADVSPSTLYRYYPTKDSIVLASFMGNTARFSEVFALSLKDLPVERALAEAIFAVLAIEDKEPKHALLVRSILGQSPAARAHLWDYLGEQQRELARLLAQATNTAPDDPANILTSRIALEVLLAAADIWRANKGKQSSRATAENLMTLLTTGAVLFPEAASTPTPPTPKRPASTKPKAKP